MAFNSPLPDNSRRQDWAWKIGLVLETPELVAEIASATAERGCIAAFECHASTSSFEVAGAVDRDRPDLIFVELSRTSKSAVDWIAEVRRGEETPLIVAVHPTADPSEMISALRAGASEFLSLPIKPAIFDAMERIGALLESRTDALTERGRIAGMLSAKGGCGATSVACHLSAALQIATTRLSGTPARILVADLDYQSPGARGVFRTHPHAHAGEAFESVRRLSSNVWREFATPVVPGIDLLASPMDMPKAVSINGAATPPEPWRVESLFRFVSRQYNWILVDLGRHLNPANWALLQNIEELFIVTAPDVLALYQTRAILQTLSNRGFDKARVKIVLNRNLSSPQDFWVESIQQMFEMGVSGVIPSDDGTLEKLPRDRFEFPADSPFGKALTKMATRLTSPTTAGPLRKTA